MNVRVILVGPEHGGNVGTVARLIKNFGFRDLWLVNPRMELGFEAEAFAAHAKDVLNRVVIVSDLDKAFEGVSFIVGTTAVHAKKTSNVFRISVTPEELAKKAVTIKGTIALLFGRESKGLSNEELRRCDVVVSIPSSPLYRTLNVSSATAILLYELWKAKSERPRGCFEEVSRDNLLWLIRLFDQFSQESSLPVHKRDLATKAFHNVVSRAFISKREATLMMGVFRRNLQIKLKSELDM
ncbi:MAG: hypothetical protein QG670_1512 [Thermoproteota archaeon]|nr:hypothetical protein [Thermoproteota archaeon]